MIRNLKMKKTLYAFDFDHTILKDNSDTEVTKLVDSPLPEAIRNFYDGTNWTQFMNKVFEFLRDQGVTVEDMKELITKMNPTPEIHHRKSLSDSKLFIISDANDIFINTFLNSINVTADCIITNKASITTRGALHIDPYENSDCPICPKNLCKGSALEEHIKSSSFSVVVYVGDGHNDICPGIKLSDQDFLFARRGYSLEKILNLGKVKGKRKTEINFDIKAQIHFWEDATSILNVVFA
ncbi:probable phosphatase phospho2 isoform X2 [Folsomia candida]|uniref:probable phosphatase phospho2 isoform X2 n=1 Tax=Folsomia candida TaxID=158441 RepID=UPI000B8FBEBD|nr:probable phosphatase phospho2 isoform X2 [Folsomia candida]